MRTENNDSRPQPSVEYWRARAEELESSLNETRVLLIRLAETLPIEYLPQLKLSAAKFFSAGANELNLDSEQAPSLSKSAVRAE